MKDVNYLLVVIYLVKSRVAEVNCVTNKGIPHLDKKEETRIYFIELSLLVLENNQYLFIFDESKTTTTTTKTKLTD